jgi:hypothetical protein
MGVVNDVVTDDEYEPLSREIRAFRQRLVA